MEEEPWDELMGPPPEEVVKQAMNRREGGGAPPVRTSTAGGAPPPSAAFAAMPDRWAQLDPPTAQENVPNSNVNEATAKGAYTQSVSRGGGSMDPLPLTRRTSSLPIEDEEDEVYETPIEMDPSGARGGTYNSSTDVAYESDASGRSTDRRDGQRIRQEALMMLEVADDQLSSSSYAVHRTISGGFSASHKTLGRKKRVPAALAGLKFTASRKPYRDDPCGETDGDLVLTSEGTREDYEYGDENVVDVVSMERRSSSSRPAAEDSTKNWSSRYSVDSTLMALSGGAMRGNYGNERKSARNMFATSPHEEKRPNAFGSGFSFRDRSGNQPNLRSQFLDTGSMPPASPRKSWQEQLRQKQRQRRIMIGVVVAVVVFIIVLASTLTTTRSRDVSAVNRGAVPAGALTFYVTSDVPYSSSEEEKMVADLKVMNTETKFFVHLGNIQKASVTLCQPSRYHDVSLLLQNSPVPTFVLPGEEDWPNCPDQDSAWDSWRNHFEFFDGKFSHDFEVARQIGRNENFAFVESNVFFAGVHLVGGRLYTEEERDRRNGENFEWVEKMAKDTAKHARAIIIFGNARPGLPQNQQFFDDLVQFLKQMGKPSMYIHANSGVGGVQEYEPFAGAGNIIALQADQGGKNPPVRVSVGTGSRPFYLG